MENVKVSYSYPGTFRDYSRQSLSFSAVFAVVLLVLMFAVLAFDRIVFGRTHLSILHLAMLSAILATAVLITQFMARSLARFRITIDEKGLTVERGSSKDFIPYRNISALDRVRIPGWWPLRPDMKPRGETASVMFRIKHRQGPPVVFIGGLSGEDELIERIRASAGMVRTP